MFKYIFLILIFCSLLFSCGKKADPEYKAKLKDMKILLPEIAFDKDTPNFVVDITKIPINILQDYGFVTRELTDEDIAAEALLKLNNNTFKIGGHLH